MKLVIWDLDETFWQGTLEEGGITAIPGNVSLVKELAGRGIVSSICSKNDHERSKAKLTELEIWDYFVFPAISFSPKGKTVKDIIETAALRPGNVLFIDDNNLNLEEVKFFNPGIMAAHPSDVLHLLSAHPNAAGNPDQELKRLQQYRLLQRKAEQRAASSLSNEEFLRASGIRISLDYDVEANFERVVELINRSNQLNYTKQRLETREQIEEFRHMLNGFGYHAGCVRAADNYGDYGLIGFYLLKRRARKSRLIHFVFSCRTMHMGIEQYVYEMLECPDLNIAQPVSYGLDTHSNIDWIALEGAAEGDSTGGQAEPRLLLLGGCDLLQLASYCSRNRIEFVNKAERKMMVRYDDPSFVLGDREAIRRCRAIRKIPCWTHEDAVQFDAALASSDVLLISLWPGMNGQYLQAADGVRVRVSNIAKDKIEKQRPDWFRRNFRVLEVSDEEKKDLIVQSLESISDRAPKKAKIFALSCCTLWVDEEIKL
ncbi:MAG: hypothetical protein JOY77_11380, partial [Alphaproteobacteria bacterium]|nr:hypothetical protein [Alphaproteobacteria bacterium]